MSQPYGGSSSGYSSSGAGAFVGGHPYQTQAQPHSAQQQVYGSSALSFSKDGELNAQPSFMSSTSSLPGALGIPSGIAGGLEGGTGWQRRFGGDADGARSIESPRPGSARGPPASPFGSGFGDSDRAAVYQAASGGGSASPAPPFDGPLADGRRGSAGNISGSGSPGMPPPRTFLVPVGATGARQKLNIISAAQRPRTAGAADRPAKSVGDASARFAAPTPPSFDNNVWSASSASSTGTFPRGRYDDARGANGGDAGPSRESALTPTPGSEPGSAGYAGAAGGSSRPMSAEERTKASHRPSWTQPFHADRRPSASSGGSSKGLSFSNAASSNSSVEAHSPRWDASTRSNASSMYTHTAESSSSSSLTEFGRSTSRAGSRIMGNIAASMRPARSSTPTRERPDGAAVSGRARGDSVSSNRSDSSRPSEMSVSTPSRTSMRGVSLRSSTSSLRASPRVDGSFDASAARDGRFASPKVSQSHSGSLIDSPTQHRPTTPSTTTKLGRVSMGRLKGIFGGGKTSRERLNSAGSGVTPSPGAFAQTLPSRGEYAREQTREQPVWSAAPVSAPPAAYAQMPEQPAPRGTSLPSVARPVAASAPAPVPVPARTPTPEPEPESEKQSSPIAVVAAPAAAAAPIVHDVAPTSDSRFSLSASQEARLRAQPAYDSDDARSDRAQGHDALRTRTPSDASAEAEAAQQSRAQEEAESRSHTAGSSASGSLSLPGINGGSFLPDAPTLKLDFDDLHSMFPDYYPADEGEGAKKTQESAGAAAVAADAKQRPTGLHVDSGLLAPQQDDKSLPPTPGPSSPLTPLASARPSAPAVDTSAATRSTDGNPLFGWQHTSSPDTSSDAGFSTAPSRQSGSLDAITSRAAEASSAAPARHETAPPGAAPLPVRHRAAPAPIVQQTRSRSSSAVSATNGTPTSARGPLPPPAPVTTSFMSPLLVTLAELQSKGVTPGSGAQHDSRPTTPTSSRAWAGDNSSNDGSTTSSAVTHESTRSPRPSLPAKSRDRPSLLPDPATLSRLEGTATPTPVKPPPATNGARTSVPGRDPSTYVPPGALMHTRRGVPVKTPVAEAAAAAAAASAAAASATATASSRTETVASSATPSAHSGPETPRATSPANGRQSPITSRFSLTSDVPSSSNPDSGEGQIISFTSQDYDLTDDGASLDEVASMLPGSAWVEIEAALQRFKESMQATAQPGLDKGALLRTVLLPFLALEAETPNVEVAGEGPFASAKARRALFFEWIRYLLMELQHVQTSADRGAILESIACIIESRNFSVGQLYNDTEDETRFSSIFGHILSYAIGELNKKGVYQNTLIFSGRLLAVAFFRVDGVASKLLRALPVNRFALERVAAEAEWESVQPADWDQYRSRFPTSLQAFCYQDARSYLKVLDAQTTAEGAASGDEENDEDRYLVRQPEVEVEMTGNWLRRWQSDDSELFFSFCRSYHRQLAGLMALQKAFETAPRLFFGGPGYAHLATCIHQKCLSLVHRDILSVTTLSSQKNFNPGETANVLSGSTAGKPRHLEAANRRCTAIVVDIVRAPNANNHIFGPMLGAHVKCLVKRTSLYDVQGVFCLLDWLDGVLNHIDTAEMHVESLVDIEFVIETIFLLLRDADHALALMRTIAFCYSNFGVLTSTSRNRTRFCEKILLDVKIFQKLFLSWSFTIRAYFLHLLVFRLARINDFPNPKDDPKGKTAVSVARLFNHRLDEIRRRHDELSPQSPSEDSGSDGGRGSIEPDGSVNGRHGRPMSFVSTIRHTPSIRGVEATTTTKAERVLGIGMPDPVLTSKVETKAQSRAAKWLRALGAKGSGRGSKKGGVSAALIDAAPLAGVIAGTESPTIRNEPRNRMPRLDEIESDSDDDSTSTGGKGSMWENGSSTTGNETPRVDDQNTGNSFEFSFEARAAQEAPAGPPTSFGDHIAPDMSFDLQSPTSPFPPGGMPGGRASPRHGASSPARISRAFSKRSSILPGPAFDLVSQDEEPEPPVPPIPMHLRQSYAKSLHIYAVQSLREYEQTVQEHDEFFASQADQGTPQVPRLPISWPAMWSADG